MSGRKYVSGEERFFALLRMTTPGNGADSTRRGLGTTERDPSTSVGMTKKWPG
jgi:hypothetical protein